MGFLTYLARRLLFSLSVVLLVALLSFFLIKLAPGDPAVLLGGEGATPQYLEVIRQEYGLNLPITQQLVIYFEHLLTGNLGFSITYSQPVITVIMERLPNTLLLVGTAFVLSLFLGVILGIASASKPYSLRDRLISTFSLLLYSTPVFVTGLLLIYIFVIKIHAFPPGGMFAIGSQTSLVTLIPSVAYHMVLPVLALSTFFLATYTLLTRAGLIEAMGMNYITMARAKGVPEGRVIRVHALRNALLPIVTVAGVQLGLIVTGAVLTENIFSWPGIGTLLIQAVEYRDFALVTGIFIITAISVAAANLAADIIYGLVDPRIRSGG
ncbi:MAG: ABC transporter permease [Nitrososphaerota archaeon]|jgi:peptide/nickel transport system permease protein|nr:ABC transporter permease [Nitrososphaerota archaeon]